MYRLYWIFIILLMVGCEKEANSDISRRLMPVEYFLSKSEVMRARYVSIYGYLAKEDNSFFIYPSEEYSRFNGLKVKDVRVKVWYPSDSLNEGCIGSYVVVYGKADVYLGVLAIDDVVNISSLEKHALKCSASRAPINYFREISIDI